MRADIVHLVARYALTLASVGIMLGLSFSYFATRVLQSMLFGVSRLEPIVYVTAVVTLILVLSLACIAPALRALNQSTSCELNDCAVLMECVVDES